MNGYEFNSGMLAVYVDFKAAFDIVDLWIGNSYFRRWNQWKSQKICIEGQRSFSASNS
jgi:hypothetical protein